jgi:hypothetical protein
MAASLLNADLRDSLAAFYGGADVLLERRTCCCNVCGRVTQEATRDTFLLMYDTCTRAEMLDKTNVMQARLMRADAAAPTGRPKRERLRHDALSLLGRSTRLTTTPGRGRAVVLERHGKHGRPGAGTAPRGGNGLVRCLVAGAPRKHYDIPPGNMSSNWPQTLPPTAFPWTGRGAGGLHRPALPMQRTGGVAAARAARAGQTWTPTATPTCC